MLRPLVRALFRSPLEAGGGFNPSQFFASGEQGAWYDPSDFATMFQDSAGTTPVTAVEQSVGLVLDKSRGLVLGPELVTNGSNLVNTTGWTAVSSTLSAVGGELVVTAAGAYGQGYFEIATVVGASYKTTCSLRRGTSVDDAGMTIQDSLGNIITTGQTTSSLTTVTISNVFVATTTVSRIVIFHNSGTPSGTIIASISSVKELPGNHSLQATSAARPTLKATPTRIDYDAVDDALVTTFASSLGTDCTVCRAVPSVGASILTGQTIGTTYTDSTDHCGLIIVNRALTASETASVTAYLNAKAGV